MRRLSLAVWFAAACTLVGSAGCAQKMAPAPYTAEQIRAANPPGTVYRYKVEGPGRPAQIRVMQFTSGSSPEKAEVRNEVLDATGRPASPPSVDRADWDDLRKHGEFPQSAVQAVQPDTIDVPAGKFDVNVYTVKAPDGAIMRFYFAKNFAGPPVVFYREEAGRRVMTSTLIERQSGGAGGDTSSPGAIAPGATAPDAPASASAASAPPPRAPADGPSDGDAGKR